jgi:hypothetical protein
MARTNLTDVLQARKMHKLKDIPFLVFKKVSQAVRRCFIAVKMDKIEPVCVTLTATQTDW